MRRNRHSISVAVVVVLACALLAIGWRFARATGPSLAFNVIANVPLPGDTSRLDYESFDPRTHRLFIAHLGAGSVIAFDTRAQRVVGTVDGTPSVRGVLAVPELGYVYAAAEGSGEIAVIDERTLAVVARISGAGDVDGLAFDPHTKHVFVSDESGHRDPVIDTRTNQIVARVDLGGEAGNTQYDSRSGRIFVAVQTRDQLVEIDPRTNAVVGRYDLPGCLHAHGVAIDVDARAVRPRGRVWESESTCSPSTPADISSTLRRKAASFDVRAGRFARIAQAFFAPNAHVVGIDDAHRLFFPLHNIEGHPLLRIVLPDK